MQSAIPLHCRVESENVQVSRFESLDGVRGLAVLLVLSAHTMETVFGMTFQYEQMHRIAVTLAKAGMTLFFVLSGTVMYLGYGALPPFKLRSMFIFFGARFARLYPLYAIVIILHGGHEKLPHIRLVIEYLSMTQSWFNDMLYLFPPAWSISTEWFFYIAFYFVFLPLSTCACRTGLASWIMRSPVRTGAAWLSCIGMALGIHLIMCNNLGWIGNKLSFLSNTNSKDILNWWSYFSPYARFLEFALGVFTGILLKSDPLNKASFTFFLGVASLIITVCMLIAYAMNPAFGMYIQNNFLFAPLFSGLIVLAIKNSFIKRLFLSRFMVFTGYISYSLYLLQFVIMGMVSTQIPAIDVVSRAIKACLIVIFSYCVAYGCYNLIEIPFQKVIRRIIRKCTSVSNLAIKA